MISSRLLKSTPDPADINIMNNNSPTVHQDEPQSDPFEAYPDGHRGWRRLAEALGVRLLEDEEDWERFRKEPPRFDEAFGV
jgi:hypothetical protein